jgi:hypothetical protein
VIERLLRWSAVVIAVLGFVDPAITLADRTRPRVSVMVQSGPSMDLPTAEDESRHAAAARVLAALQRDLESQFELVEGSDRTAAAAIVIGDRYPEEPLAVAQPTSTVSVATPISPNVRIVDVEVPRAVPSGTAVRLGVEIEAVGVRGLVSSVVARAADAELARASHPWTADRERWRAVLDVAPLGRAPFVFEIAAEPLASERTVADNRETVSVAESPALRVLAFDARPSWASAFVRRALESDPRFRVSGLSEVSPHAHTRSGESPALPGDGLDAFDAIIVGGLDRLSAADAKTLSRFMAERGGSVALAPDGRLAGAAVQTIVGTVASHETVLGRSSPLAGVPGLPRIDASELLQFRDLPLRAAVLARAGAGGDPVVWTAPRGSGLLLVSGAMDAWRYRGEPGVEFERFWRSAASGLALAARPAVDVELTPRRIAAGDRVHVVARVRGIEADRFGDLLALSARTGPADRVPGLREPVAPLRLWPTPARGVFEGWFTAPPAPLRVDVMIGDNLASGTAAAAIDNAAREADGPPLSLLAATRGGVDVVPRDITSLEHHLRTTVSGQPALAVRHPMRSALWVWPFAASLSAEWWLRRRRGLG